MITADSLRLAIQGGPAQATLVLVSLFGALLPASGQSLLAEITLVDEDIRTVDPVCFRPSALLDIYEVVVTNDTDSDLVALDLAFDIPYFDESCVSFIDRFRDTTDLPALGPNTVPVTFFVTPPGTADDVVSDGPRFGRDPTIQVAYSLGDSTALIPARTSATVAVLTALADMPAPTGNFGFANLRDVTGQQRIIFVPEPVGGFLSAIALVCSVMATCRRSREARRFSAEYVPASVLG